MFMYKNRTMPCTLNCGCAIITQYLRGICIVHIMHKENKKLGGNEL